MSFLLTELQGLVSETRRKHTDVRDAANNAISILRSVPDAVSIISNDGQASQDVLRPLFMGCATRNAKIVVMSLSSLNRLITSKCIPVLTVPEVITTMSECMSQGVDVQLRILQILLSLLTNYPETHGELLAEALLLCFKLQESRIAVVSSTAAATLRQLVMLVFEKVIDMDRKAESSSTTGSGPISDTKLPDGQIIALHPAARDAFAIFEDLCLAANLEKPKYLQLESLPPKTFSLELIESVLTNYHELFRQRTELLILLRHHLCPTLLKALSEKPIFPLTLRSIRVVFLLLKEFIHELETEAEVFLSLVTRVIAGDSDNNEPTRPLWMRVLAMEIMRGLCNDSVIVRALWDRYDSKNRGSSIFISLVTALKRLAMEKPSLLGVAAQMFGTGVTSTSSDLSTYGIDVGAVSSMMTSAASMVGMSGGGGGLSVHGSSMKLQCIDQLDKADSPIIPDTYVYLLALQCIVSLTGALASMTLPLYNTITLQRPRSPGDAVLRAAPALDLTLLEIDADSLAQLRTAHDMVDNAWPAMLASLSYFISTNLSEELFSEVLLSIQNMANTSGALGLFTPRDAFLTCLAKFAIPQGVVSSLDTPSEPLTPRSVLSVEGLGLSPLTGGSQQPPSLSERNMACLKVLLSSALFLAGSMGASWFSVLETLQNAEYVLFTKGAVTRKGSTGPASVGKNRSTVPLSVSTSSGPPIDEVPSRPSLMRELDPTDVQNLISRLFDASKSMDDEAFGMFVQALCKLSSEMVGMQAVSRGMDTSTSPEEQSTLLSPSLLPGTADSAHRRRASGIQLARSPPRGGDYGVSKLGVVSQLNMHRLIYREPTLAWNPITGHLLSIVRNSLAPGSIRIQAAEILDAILVISPRNLTTSGEFQSEVQRRVLDVLSQQVIFDVHSAVISSVNTDVRKLGLETLHEILQSSGHTLRVGWSTIFGMMSSVCSQPIRQATIPSPLPESTKARPPPLRTPERGNPALARIAFKSLTLVCDSVNSLQPEDLRLCITTIALFGKQGDTNMALTAAESLLWSVSDSIQSKRKENDQDSVYSELWMFLLNELRSLCADYRSDVRNGAIQTLFRSLQLYGATLSSGIWTQCLQDVVFPLLDSLSTSLLAATAASPDLWQESQGTEDPGWDVTKSLAFQLVGSIFSAYLLDHIMPLEQFSVFWNAWATHVTNTAANEPRNVGVSALQSLQGSLGLSKNASGPTLDVAAAAWERSWIAMDEIGQAIHDQASNNVVPTSSASTPFTQDCLLAYIGCLRSIYALFGSSWDLERLRRLLHILKSVLTYSRSPEYRPDIDSLSPVQAAVCETVDELEVDVAGFPSIVLADVADYANLAFIAAFDVEGGSGPRKFKPALSSAPKRVTYVALAKRSMPRVVQLYKRYRSDSHIYKDGTVEHILSSFSIPIRLRYDCPAPSKFGSDRPLWKTATDSFLDIFSYLSGCLVAFGEEVPNNRVEAIWKQAVDGIRGGLLADCSSLDHMSFQEQANEEDFDLKMLLALSPEVLERIGDSRVGDAVILQLVKCIRLASTLHVSDDSMDGNAVTLGSPSRQQFKNGQRNPKELSHTVQGTTAPSRPVIRERFSYWCLKFLFMICTEAKGELSLARRRIAALTLPSLLGRCHSVMSSYLADETLRGNAPFPRIREEELIYVLRHLRDLRLWPGCLWAALSDSPSSHCASLPPIDISFSSRSLIADVARRSTQAHLFHLFVLLQQIATVPRILPSAWIIPIANNDPFVAFEHADTHNDLQIGTANEDSQITATAVELDSRSLAGECLRQIGEEIGAEV